MNKFLHFAAIFSGVVWLTGVSSLRAQPAVDFVRDVQPILQQHCWKCHSERRAAGGLRLDERKFAEQGGGSGRNLLELAGAKNELLRRVRTMAPAERMPQDAPPLTASEIATLERWIAQGAAWPDKPAMALPAWNVWRQRWEYATSPRYVPVSIAALVVLTLMLGLERISAWRESRPGSGQHMRISRAWHLVGLLCVALFAVVQYAREQVELREREPLHTDPLTGASDPKSYAKRHEPYRPQHPHRLGGTYYRGNDERSEALYNGGFYRTATFHIHLTDADGEPLVWGDPTPAKPHLRFEIVRSPHASPALFTPDIMDHVWLSTVQPEQLKTVPDLQFTLLAEREKGERWAALFPLEAIPAVGKLAGKVYVYKGSSSGAIQAAAEPSYLIGYELAAEDGNIAPSSQVWMASIYNVSSLQWPQPGKIPADQWFDFRPIPEIQQPPPAAPNQ